LIEALAKAASRHESQARWHGGGTVAPEHDELLINAALGECPLFGAKRTHRDGGNDANDLLQTKAGS